MDYLVPDEVSFIPGVGSNPLLNTTTKRIGYIRSGSAAVDAACGRSEYGLALRDIIDEQILLDLNFTGKLMHRPWFEWIGSLGTISYFGDDQVAGADTIELADFHVLEKSGVIRNLSSRPSSLRDAGFSSGRMNYESPYAQASIPYHGRTFGQIEDNSTPYILKASYRAGFFVETAVEASGAVGTSFLTVTSVRGLKAGQEFYFSEDPAGEPTVDARIIMEVDSITRKVTFTPQLGYAMTAASRLRRIDKAVRSACADFISDIITFPANTKAFSKGLGKGDLVKSWVRMDNQDVPIAAFRKLQRYVRV